MPSCSLSIKLPALVRLIIFLTLPLFLSGCYHLRMEAEQVTPRIFEIKTAAPEAFGRIRKLVEEKWQQRNLDDETSGNLIITTPYHFATDTGAGQPAGGRRYYVRLKIQVAGENGLTRITISPYNYEIRTSYAYGLDGRLRSMYKHYPYEEYPGMFDLVPLEKELDRVTTAINDLFRQDLPIIKSE